MLIHRHDRESGSIALTVAVLFILVGLSAALLERNFSATKQTRQGQDFSAALASADGGLADALFKLDQEVDPLAMPATLPGSGTLSSGATYAYKGVMVDPETYRFQVKGTENNVPHGIEAIVVRTLRYPYAIFTNQGLSFNGNAGTSVRSEPVAGLAKVGSNGPISVASGSGGGDTQDYFTPSGSCSGCGNGVQKDGPYPIPDPTPPSGTTRTCPPPSGTPPVSTFSGTVTTGDPFVCSTDVRIRSISISGTGTVEIFIPANRNLDMSGGAVINSGGSASKLIVNKAGTGTLDIGTGANSVDFTGVLYAPSSDMTINGGAKFRGSLTLNRLTINGSPNYELIWDSDLRPVVDKNWRVRYWREIPSSSVAL